MTIIANAIQQSTSKQKTNIAHRLILQRLSNIQYGKLKINFEKTNEHFLIGNSGILDADITIHNTWGFIKAVTLSGDLGFGEAHINGYWSSKNLSGLLLLLSANLEALNKVQQRKLPVKLLSQLQHKWNRNSIVGSRRNIQAHYDLGNNFYQRWLDRSMTYSSAIYENTDDLFEAQNKKYGHLFDLIDPEPGEHILEIGCGWGGFAEHAAKWDVNVTGITLSNEQYAYARNRLSKAKLTEKTDIRLIDYRHVNEKFDHIVSIEMFEAVGQAYWKTYFEKVAECLKPGGKVALQVITIREDLFDQYVKEAGGFIQKYIFPGGMLPTSTHLNEYAFSAGLTPVQSNSFGEHYADTLAQWAENFSHQSDWMEQHGYDARFRRMWDYYLAFCEAGFRDGRINVVQFCAEKEIHSE